MAAEPFQVTYVKIAEATAASRDALTAAVPPMSDTDDYNGTTLDGNVKTVVDVQTKPLDGSFTETNISETQFELDTLAPANRSWGQVRDVAVSSAPYLGLVIAINDFVTVNVLGVDGYSDNLQDFLDNDCIWDSDPSANAGAPTSWIILMQSAGYPVVDTNPDNG